jgi:acyl carrier protein
MAVCGYSQVVSAVILIKRMAKPGQTPPFYFESLWQEAISGEEVPAKATTGTIEANGQMRPHVVKKDVDKEQVVQVAKKGVDKEQVASRLQGIVQSLFGLQVSSTQPLMEAGLDSLSAAELQNAVKSAFSADLPATVMFDYPTLDALASYVAAQLSTPSITGTPYTRPEGNV